MWIQSLCMGCIHSTVCTEPLYPSSKVNGENFDIPDIPNPPAPNGLLSSTVTFSGFMPDHLESVSAWSAHAARAHNLHCSDPIHLPTILRRWDVIKGPFAHAKTKEVFERKTYQRTVQIVDAPNGEVVRKWTKYVVEIRGRIDARVCGRQCRVL
ncbi:hypothetical protein BJ742DRAFT_198529 [Cladochytrium replicatum]|nr:hypothetical protein BJ742DRAFT_198529 [Cladochytrium replicatum]